MTIPYQLIEPYLLADLQQLDSEITTANNNISTINGEITTINGEITSLQTLTASPNPAFFAAGPSSLTTIAATTTYTTGGISLASQTLTSSSVWRVRSIGSYVAVSSATARSARIACVWGGTVLTNFSIPVLVSTAQTTGFVVEMIVSGTGATSLSVAGMCNCQFNSASALANFGLAPTSNTGLSSGAQTLDLQFSMSAAVAGDAWHIFGVTIERLA